MSFTFSSLRCLLLYLYSPIPIWLPLSSEIRVLFFLQALFNFLFLNSSFTFTFFSLSLSLSSSICPWLSFPHLFFLLWLRSLLQLLFDFILYSNSLSSFLYSSVSLLSFPSLNSLNLSFMFFFLLEYFFHVLFFFLSFFPFLCLF